MGSGGGAHGAACSQRVSRPAGVHTKSVDLTALLRDAVESGDWSRLRERLADDALMRTSNERERRRVAGAEAIVRHLTRSGPGEVTLWEAHEWPTGVALTFEWAGASTDRRRWYLRTDSEGLVREIWSAAARPAAGGAASPAPPPPALLARIGAERVEPLAHAGNSGAALLRATSARGAFVLKRVTAGTDWLARVTRDDGRTARLHAAGAFDAMPQAIDHGIVDVERVDEVAWVAMRDVSALLLAADARLSRAQSRTVLAAAAQLHRSFRGRVPDGAASLRDRLRMASPRVAAEERSSTDLLPKQFEHAWEAFAELVPADVAEPVLALTDEPGPLARALVSAAGEATLMHGDLRDDNLGFDGQRVVLIDWDMASAGTPTVDFAWYLA